MILIVDFGSQTTHLIGRRIRDLGVEVRIVDSDNALAGISKYKPAGIILSGGPASVYEKGSPSIDPIIFTFKIPILGICYGWQQTARLLKGKVIQGHKEYGPTEVKINHRSPLFENIKARELKVWMSHGDEVVKLPVGFDYHVSTPTVKAAGVGDFERKIFGVQFHPEVEHTQEGKRILQNFVEIICGLKVSKRKINVNDIIKQVKDIVDQKGENAKAIAAVSGGVDSTVASTIVAKAMGKKFIPIYCDNGLMREGTTEEVKYIFEKLLKIKPVILDSKKEFLSKLKKVTDPEKKRIIIGNLYIDLFQQEAKKIKNTKFLVQGTIYSDVIESKGSKNASKIKSHHNVGGLPKKMNLDLLEPLRNFYKDEVRELGRQLGLPEDILMKQPFPGPGQAIRILGEVTEERLAKQQQADKIVLEIIKSSGWYNKIFQSFPIMTGTMSTAVKGDGRVYGEIVGLRVYDSNDIMTAGWAHLPYELLQKISSRIVNEVPDVSRVVYDITTKPPATMEWE
ncbi:glutamine-hydrolyzing GMP synthase [Candidatus Beckwithbacteria bacterium]|nr:glutamine-hydrolyzing GMP synthase [Candidatus Beckwithbacteria bacterium]